MTVAATRMVIKDLFLETEQKDNWELVLVGEDNLPVSVTISTPETLCRLIHQLTYMIPMGKLKEEDKQELIWAIEQMIPLIYRNYVLDEYTLD
ncbi:hypothetical protein [Brevibacillus fulvus]|uniref:Uncharacterized protein n=1 Tax=Brevibacillus fulvus TaxID=1125967 RepID=A0A939BR70_9BACL|nr:hypothetical protein [Brevibacillus fulvus]MBM7589277.1 hypothetical protein [Brevibacillus fulvus]